MSVRRIVSKDSIAACILIVISVTALWKSKDLNAMSAVFPRTVGVILFVLSLIYLFKSIVTDQPREEPRASIDKRRVIVMACGMLIYVAAFRIVGFLLASIGFLYFFVWLLQGREMSRAKRSLKALLFSLSISFGFYLLFRYVFLVPFPDGLLFD